MLIGRSRIDMISDIPSIIRLSAQLSEPGLNESLGTGLNAVPLFSYSHYISHSEVRSTGLVSFKYK